MGGSIWKSYEIYVITQNTSDHTRYHQPYVWMDFAPFQDSSDPPFQDPNNAIYDHPISSICLANFAAPWLMNPRSPMIPSTSNCRFLGAPGSPGLPPHWRCPAPASPAWRRSRSRWWLPGSCRWRWIPCSRSGWPRIAAAAGETMGGASRNMLGPWKRWKIREQN